MRLIDADALIQHTYSAVVDGVETDIIDVSNVDNAPTVEYTFAEAFQNAVCKQRLYCPERPRGEWTNTSPYDDKGECPFCCYLSKKYYKFCPNCGAEMRKEEKE